MLHGRFVVQPVSRLPLLALELFVGKQLEPAAGLLDVQLTIGLSCLEEW
jgi:hypothetical protein